MIWYSPLVQTTEAMLSFDLLTMAGFLQLAGGTNAHTVDGLKKVGLFQTTSFHSNIIPPLIWSSTLFFCNFFIPIFLQETQGMKY